MVVGLLLRDCQKILVISKTSFLTLNRSRLQKGSELEGTAKGVLRLLGKIERPYLTPLEEEMLKLVEKVYG